MTTFAPEVTLGQGIAPAPSADVMFPPSPVDTDPYWQEARMLNGNPDLRMAAIMERLSRVPEENQKLAGILGDLATDLVGKPMGFKHAPGILRALDVLGGVDLLAEDQSAAEIA